MVTFLLETKNIRVYFELKKIEYSMLNTFFYKMPCDFNGSDFRYGFCPITFSVSF